MKKINDDELWPHIKKLYYDRSIQKSNNECWGWKGTVKVDGYACFKFRGKVYPAHRVAWEIHFGKIPDGLIVGHHCDNRSCTRVDHLYLGTNYHNSQDMVRKGRQALGIKNGGAKLTEEDVKEIKTMIGNRPVVEIAKIFKVSRSTVFRIKSGKLWSHVE